jgi:exodeoxyribonuclease VII small subunit
LGKKQPKQEVDRGPSFEEGLDQLEAIVRQLEEGEIGLNEALKQYEKGVKLLRQCYDLLRGAERRIELLSGIDPEGNPISSPMQEPAASPNDRAPGRRRSNRDSVHPPDRGDARVGDTDIGAPEGFS